MCNIFKVCLISSGLIRVPPQYGGAVERYVYYMARSLRKLKVEADVLDAKYSVDDPNKEGTLPRIIRLEKVFNSSFAALSEFSFGLAIWRFKIMKSL